MYCNRIIVGEGSDITGTNIVFDFSLQFLFTCMYRVTQKTGTFEKTSKLSLFL